jgi:two-component sensor histidine kinase
MRSTIAHTLPAAPITAVLREKRGVSLRDPAHNRKHESDGGIPTLRVECNSDEDYQATLEPAEIRISAMARVHEKLYRPGRVGEVRMDEYLSELVEEWIGFHRAETVKIIFDTNLEPLSFDIDDAISWGIVVLQLVTNAIKHAFPGSRAGVVEIGLRTILGDGAELVVRDNGVGFPDDFSLRAVTSSGLMLVQAIVGRFQGEITLGGGPGAEIGIYFKRYEE